MTDTNDPDQHLRETTDKMFQDHCEFYLVDTGKNLREQSHEEYLFWLEKSSRIWHEEEDE